jgi:four helix bundle protein
MKTANRKGETGTDRRAARNEFRRRTFQFGIRCIRVAETLPRSITADIVARQLIRAGTSVGANYRAAIRGRSPAEFIAKLGLVEEECDEARFWLETLVALDLVRSARVAELQREGDAIIAITIASIKTARNHEK